MSIDDTLAEVEQLNAAATPGPWRHNGDSPDVYGAKGCGRVLRASEQFMDRAERVANAKLAARYRTACPELAAEVRRLTAEHDHDHEAAGLANAEEVRLAAELAEARAGVNILRIELARLSVCHVCGDCLEPEDARCEHHATMEPGDLDDDDECGCAYCASKAAAHTEKDSK